MEVLSGLWFLVALIPVLPVIQGSLLLGFG